LFSLHGNAQSSVCQSFFDKNLKSSGAEKSFVEVFFVSFYNGKKEIFQGAAL
jgi:hypothetical protein